MRIFHRLFQKTTPQKRVMPSWEEIVKIMYNQQPAYINEVVSVVYSNDKSMRYVVLKHENGLYSYQLEAIRPFEEEEWNYICMVTGKDWLPAEWATSRCNLGSSFFENEEELRKEMQQELEYKRYFS